MKSNEPTAGSPFSEGGADLRTACAGFVFAYLRANRVEAAREGIPVRHPMILRMLLKSGRTPVTRIAAFLEVSPSTLSGALDELASAGFLRREHGIDDRRQVLVSLSARGRRAAERIETRLSAQWSTIERDLPPSDVEASVRVLKALGAGLRPTGRRSGAAGREPVAATRPRSLEVAPEGGAEA